MNPVAVRSLLVDVIAGEPSNAAHPTVWMGRSIALARNSRRSRSELPSLLEGALLMGAGVGAAWIAATVTQRAIGKLPRSSRSFVTSVALKPALSLRALIAAARRVQRALEARDLPRARALLARHLVSRDTRDLTRAEVAGAVIESVAENLSDSVVAPLLAFRVGGLAGAYTYRFINTADAMLGYRTPELEWFGKSAARLDDCANFLPARITALLIACSAAAGSGSGSLALRCARTDSSFTDSPNAGWPMAAMAGALDVRLTKRGQYVLNAQGSRAGPRDIASCCRIVLAAAALAAVVMDCL